MPETVEEIAARLAGWIDDHPVRPPAVPRDPIEDDPDRRARIITAGLKALRRNT